MFFLYKQESYLIKFEGKRIEITDTLSSNQAIEDFVKPYREYIENDLDSVLTYSIDTYSNTNGHLNTALGILSLALFSKCQILFLMLEPKKL